MRVAISGGTGFIGSYLIDELLSKDITPVILTRNKTNHHKENYIVTDYHYDSLISQMKEVDAFIHLAFKRGKHGRISEFHENEIITQVLFDVCKDLKIKNIINASTISVYGDPKELPWSEKSIIKPDLMYGVSKFTNECIGNIYSDKYNMCVKNLRIAHVFGFNEKNNYMINKFMRQAYLKQTLEIDYPARAKREFIYAKDVAKAIRLSLSCDKTGVFNIGSGINLTNEEVAININNVFENNNNLSIKNKKGIEILNESYMDSSKAYQFFGYRSDYSFDDALKEIYEQMKELKYVPENY